MNATTPPPPQVVDTTTPKNPGLQLIADSMIAPLVISEPADGSKRLFVADETGTIWIIGADGKKLANPFIDISGRMVTLSTSYDERGLLGMAFSSGFQNERQILSVLYSTAKGRYTGARGCRIGME